MRLIDGDDFQKRIEQLCDALCEYSKKQRQFMCSACKLGDVLDVIDDAPTVDAVPVGAYEQVVGERNVAVEQLRQLGYELGESVTPVVRCKDCKWFEDANEECGTCGFF